MPFSPSIVAYDPAGRFVTAAAADSPGAALSPDVGYTPVLLGTSDPGATVAITENGTAVATVQAGANGEWLFDPAHLSPGPHFYTASAAGAAGPTASAPVWFDLPTIRADVTDVTESSWGSVTGVAYAGPVPFLQSQYIYAGSDNLAITATGPNTFLHGGAGDDALQAVTGSNVLDGGTGSNFLVGADGNDGGADVFYTDARGDGVTWSTLVNFHLGDYATLWGFDPKISTWHWDGISGAGSYAGATLRADVHGTGNTDASITFAGLTMDRAQRLEVVSGTADGNGYLLFHNPGV